MEGRRDSPVVILARALPPGVIAAMLLQIAVIVGAVMIGSVLLGLAIDARAGTRPLFTLVLGLLSLPLSAWLTYRIALRAIAKARAAYETYLASQRSA
jgi:F0F1-type ATP synthase assembly protein I